MRLHINISSSSFSLPPSFAGLFSQGEGTIYGSESDCAGCGIAWLYSDAKQYGREDYLRVMGGEVYCNGLGPVIDPPNPDFLAQLEACSGTMRKSKFIHDALLTLLVSADQGNPCQGNPGDLVVDPVDCRCFVHCDPSGNPVGGSECCPLGLVFNPEIQGCDWDSNVPSCDA